jgi:hypothetical protein
MEKLSVIQFQTESQMEMPYWLALTLKIFITVATVAILIGMCITVKKFSSILKRKVTMIILYVAIVGALLLDLFHLWIHPRLKDDRKIYADQIEIFSLFLQYVFVQSVFITSFECLYSLKYKL